MNHDSERKPYQKIILCLFAAMAVIFAIWTAISHANEGVLFYGELLSVSTEGDTTVYSGEYRGTGITITCWEENGAKLVNVTADGQPSANCRVEYPEGTIKTEFGTTAGRIRIIKNDTVLFSGGYDPDADVYRRCFNEDGTWNPSFHTGTSQNTDPSISVQFDAMDILRFANTPALSSCGSWPHYFLALVLSIVGGLSIAFPDTLFYLRHFLHVQDPEPTEFYYAVHKVSSIFFTAVVLFLYLWAATYHP